MFIKEPCYIRHVYAIFIKNKATITKKNICLHTLRSTLGWLAWFLSASVCKYCIKYIEKSLQFLTLIKLCNMKYSRIICLNNSRIFCLIGDEINLWNNVFWRLCQQKAINNYHLTDFRATFDASIATLFQVFAGKCWS